MKECKSIIKWLKVRHKGLNTPSPHPPPKKKSEKAIMKTYSIDSLGKLNAVNFILHKDIQ